MKYAITTCLPCKRTCHKVAGQAGPRLRAPARLAAIERRVKTRDKTHALWKSTKNADTKSEISMQTSNQTPHHSHCAGERGFPVCHLPPGAYLGTITLDTRLELLATLQRHAIYRRLQALHAPEEARAWKSAMRFSRLPKTAQQTTHWSVAAPTPPSAMSQQPMPMMMKTRAACSRTALRRRKHKILNILKKKLDAYNCTWEDQELTGWTARVLRGAIAGIDKQ